MELNYFVYEGQPDCYNAGATLPPIHSRDPKTGHISRNFNQYNDQVGRLRKAVPKMILQLGGPISLPPSQSSKPSFRATTLTTSWLK